MLSDMDSGYLYMYLNKLSKEEFIKLHYQELKELYHNIMKKKEKQPVPPDMIIRCKDHENINLNITLSEFKTLLESDFINGALD